MSSDWMCEKAVELGADEARIIDPKDVVVGEWVRLKCQYGCGYYGARLTCPPFAPPPETTLRLLSEYSTAVLLRMELVGEDLYRSKSADIRAIVAELERQIFLAGYPKAWGLPVGHCELCDPCDVTKGCRFPNKARPPMEACGIDVNATALRAGWDFTVATTRQSAYQFFGLVLVE